MEAMRWDFDSMIIADSLPGEMNPVRSIKLYSTQLFIHGKFFEFKMLSIL